MATAIAAHPISQPDRIAIGRLGWVGPLAIAAAVGANVLFAMVATAVAGIDPEYPALTSAAVAQVTAFCVLIAVGVFAAVARFSSQPVRLYRRIALVALVLSFIPDLALLFTDDTGVTGVREVVVLMLTHVVAAAVCVPILTSLGRDSSAE